MDTSVALLGVHQHGIITDPAFYYRGGRTISPLLRPIANLDATRSFVFILKSRFCKWRAQIGQRCWQPFSLKEKIVSCGLVGVVCFPIWQMVEQFACNVSKQVLFLTEVDEFIDISGLPERNVYGSVRCRGNVTKYTRAFKFITCLSAPDERNRLYFSGLCCGNSF